MEIKIVKEDKDYGSLLLKKEIHLVLPANEMPFGMCKAYLDFQCGLSYSEIEKLVSQVNEKQEVGTLFPKFQLTLFPSTYPYWDSDKFFFPQFDKHTNFFKDIFEIEHKYIKSKHIVVDLFASELQDNTNLNKTFRFTRFLEEFCTNNSIETDMLIEIRKTIVPK